MAHTSKGLSEGLRDGEVVTHDGVDDTTRQTVHLLAPGGAPWGVPTGGTVAWEGGRAPVEARRRPGRPRRPSTHAETREGLAPVTGTVTNGHEVGDDTEDTPTRRVVLRPHGPPVSVCARPPLSRPVPVLGMGVGPTPRRLPTT